MPALEVREVEDGHEGPADGVELEHVAAEAVGDVDAALADDVGRARGAEGRRRDVGDGVPGPGAAPAPLAAERAVREEVRVRRVAPVRGERGVVRVADVVRPVVERVRDAAAVQRVGEVDVAADGERVDGRGHDGEADEEQLAAVEERLDEEPHLREALERPQGPQEPHDAQRAQRHVRLIFGDTWVQHLQEDRNGVRVDALGDDRGVDEVPGVVEVRAAPGRDLDEELEEEEDEERELEAALPRVVFGLVVHRRGEREEHRVDDDREEHAAVERPRRREPLEPPGLLFALRVVHFVERWRNAGDRGRRRVKVFDERPRQLARLV